MTTSTGVIAWAYTRLSAFAGGRIYDSTAPQNLPKDASGNGLSFIILQQQSYAEQGTSVAGDVGMARMLLLAKAVTASAGFSSAEDLFAQIDANLQKASGTAAGVTVSSCVRQSIVRYTELREGVRYNHLGATYAVFCAAA